MRIRAAGPEDVPAVLALWAVARSAAARTPDSEAVLEALLARDAGAVLVAEEGGEIVGTLIAAWDGWRGSMYRLAVLPELRRRGIGRALVEAGEERLRAFGDVRVTALVGRGEVDAEGLWEAAGFEHDEGIARYVRNL